MMLTFPQQAGHGPVLSVSLSVCLEGRTWPSSPGTPGPRSLDLGMARQASQPERQLRPPRGASRAVTPGLLISGGSAFCNCPATCGLWVGIHSLPSVPPRTAPWASHSPGNTSSGPCLGVREAGSGQITAPTPPA